ncbi:hypothetical protein [uncultured Polaribacter sp.]|uniref:hypothetical protein n=1 Tax=uncultured Polaribacter sp. TaxID=174711 RepID=UPI002636902E|nr:hypothetical protein [uncultured Polaribacter sp.]
MKKIHILYVLIILLFTNCNNEDYIAPSGYFSSFLWFTSKGFDASNYNTNLNSYVGFTDLSKNAISHSWSIPSGTSLLENTFSEKDSIYTDFIKEAGPLTIKEDLLNVLFTEPGVKEIVLNNVFKDSVAESTKQEDGTWLVEKTFTVTVYDDVKPAFQILRGTEIVLDIDETDMPDISNQASWKKLTIEAGEELVFLDKTVVGQPNLRTWTFDGGNIPTSVLDSVGVLYNSLGNFSGGSITSSRTDVESAVSIATKLIPVNIEVIPSTKPFVINGEIVENESEVLSFNVTGEVANVTGEEGNFTVHVVNMAAGFDQNIPVSSVTINSNDATQIDLVLTQPIFNTDVITLSYTAGNITSVDQRNLASFSNQAVEMNFQGAMNIDGYTGYEIEWGGSGNQFKKANTEGYFAQHNANNENGPLYYFRDDSMAFEGNSSMKFETPAAGIPTLARLQGGQYGNLSPVSAGSYIPSVWVFIDPATTMTNIQYNFTASVEGTFNFDISITEKGKWVRLTLPEVTLPDLTAGRFDINITENGQNDAIVQKLWLDNFDLLILEDR